MVHRAANMPPAPIRAHVSQEGGPGRKLCSRTVKAAIKPA